MQTLSEANAFDRVVSDEGVRNRILYDALTQDKLELILFPTEKCNFRCTYCYEDFAVGRMRPEIINGIKRLLDNRAADLKTLHLSWFGGEPLIAYDIVTDVSRHAHALSRSHAFDSVVSITTNGYNLNERRFVELGELGTQKIQISLDGDPSSHDRTRLRIDGAGTFAKIWANLRTFSKLRARGEVPGTHIILRLHVHPHNVQSLRQLVSMIRQELLPEAFTVHFKSVGHWGSKNDKDFDVFSDEHPDYKSLQASLYDSLDAFKPEFVDEVYVCYAAKANSFTIRADGSIGKCTVALDSKANSIGRITEDGQLDLNAPKFGRWLHSLSSMNNADLGCPIARLPRELETFQSDVVHA